MTGNGHEHPARISRRALLAAAASWTAVFSASGVIGLSPEPHRPTDNTPEPSLRPARAFARSRVEGEPSGAIPK